MSFKVGDLCEIFGAPIWAGAYNPVGYECEVIGPEAWRDGSDGKTRAFGYHVRLSNGDKFCVNRQYLQKRRPPNSEFQPAEPEFVSDLLKRLGRVSA